MAKSPIALIIMDGYGINPNHEGNAIYEAKNYYLYIAKSLHLCYNTIEMVCLTEKHREVLLWIILYLL